MHPTGNSTSRCFVRCFVWRSKHLLTGWATRVRFIVNNYTYVLRNSSDRPPSGVKYVPSGIYDSLQTPQMAISSFTMAWSVFCEVHWQLYMYALTRISDGKCRTRILPCRIQNHQKHTRSRYFFRLIENPTCRCPTYRGIPASCFGLLSCVLLMFPCLDNRGSVDTYVELSMTRYV